jgi:hypothetical protein
MKSFNKILMIVFSLAFLMFACKEDDVVSTEKEKEAPYLTYEGAADFWFPKEAGFIEVPVTDVNGAYFARVSENSEWCTTSDIAINSFKIHYAENRRAEDRNATITLSLDGVADKVITVGQRGPDPTLTTDSTIYKVIEDPISGAKSLELPVPYTSNDIIVPVRTNGDYNVEIEANEWCVVANKADDAITFSTSLNTDFERGRSVKVAVSLTYGNLTRRFEFVMAQSQMPSLAPEDGTVIAKEDGFPYNFTWKKNQAVSAYSVVISTNSNFTEEATKVINAGNVENYTVQLSDIAELLALSYEVKVPLYWTVRPTNPGIDITVETVMIYVQRTFVTSYPLTLTNTGSSWTGLYYDKDFEGDDDPNFPKMALNGGRSSRRTFMGTNPLEVSIEPDKRIAVAYEYKTSNVPPDYPYETLSVYHMPAAYSYINQVNCRITNEWLTNRASLRTSHPNWWGQEGEAGYYNTVWFFVMPEVITAADQMTGAYLHFHDIRLEVYDE